jgi:hypothetical protein
MSNTEKNIRQTLHILADNMIAAAGKHGSDKVNVTAFFPDRHMSGITVNTRGSKYNFRIDIHTSGKLYSIDLEEMHMNRNQFGYPDMSDRIKFMCREIYANHADIIESAYKTRGI